MPAVAQGQRLEGAQPAVPKKKKTAPADNAYARRAAWADFDAKPGVAGAEDGVLGRSSSSGSSRNRSIGSFDHVRPPDYC